MGKIFLILVKNSQVIPIFQSPRGMISGRVNITGGIIARRVNMIPWRVNLPKVLYPDESIKNPPKLTLRVVIPRQVNLPKV